LVEAEQDRQDEDVDSEDDCEKEDTKEQPRVVKLILAQSEILNKGDNFEVVKIFRRKFETFHEITVLIKFNNKYYYFYVTKMVLSGQLIFQSVEDKDRPCMNGEKYTVCNRERTLKKKQIDESVIQVLNDQHPDTRDYSVIMTRVRQFPNNKQRFIIVYRFATEKRRYIVEKTEQSVSIVEWKVTATGLRELRNNKKPEQISDIVEHVITDIEEEKNEVCE